MAPQEERDHTGIAEGDRLRAVAAEPTAKSTRLAAASGVPSSYEEDWSFFREALPKYDVQERIHYGGQGVVYRAVDRVAKRTVAIKVLLHGPLSSERQRRRLLREMEVVARLRHPDIVTLYEAGEVRGRPYLVMEFVDGMPIDDYVLLNDLSVRQIVRLYARVCRAVGNAHGLGVIHRDIKPANILVDAHGKPSVLDFGLAKDIAAGDPNQSWTCSHTGEIVGTLPYLSPEQASGANRAVDVRSDIYSLGIVLFELITGSFPYPVDGSVDAVRANILSREPMRLRKGLGRNTCDRPGALRDINDDLEKVVLKALAKERERRYHSGASFADDLDRYLMGHAVEAKSASSFYVLRKSLRRLWIPLAIAAAVSMVATIATVLVLTERIKTTTIAGLAERGLQIGGLVRLGSVAADEGRVDRAVSMFEAAIEIGSTAGEQNQALLRFRYDALHRLSELYYDIAEPDKGDHYARAATELIKKVVSSDPENLEWRRLLGACYRLQGRGAYARENWVNALGAYEQAVAIAEGIASVEPNNTSLKADLASLLACKGDPLRKLGRYDEALESYNAALKTYQELVLAEPEVKEHMLELARTEVRIGTVYLSLRTEDADNIASEWFDLALGHVAAFGEPRKPADPTATVDRLLDSIRRNQDAIRKRADQRAKG